MPFQYGVQHALAHDITSNTFVTSFIGTAHVFVVEARNLSAKSSLDHRRSLSHRNDPYCKLQIGKKKYKTKAKMSQLSPKWNEGPFIFENVGIDDILYVVIRDKVNVGQGHTFGAVLIPVKEFPQIEQQMEFYLSTGKKPRGQCGTLVLRMFFHLNTRRSSENLVNILSIASADVTSMEGSEELNSREISSDIDIKSSDNSSKVSTQPTSNSFQNPSMNDDEIISDNQRDEISSSVSSNGNDHSNEKAFRNSSIEESVRTENSSDIKRSSMEKLPENRSLSFPPGSMKVSFSSDGVHFQEKTPANDSFSVSKDQCRTDIFVTGDSVRDDAVLLSNRNHESHRNSGNHLRTSSQVIPNGTSSSKKLPQIFRVLTQSPSFKLERAEKKNQSFRKLFNLPETENVFYDCSASIMCPTMHHGRLYCSERYLCFYSNLFGNKILQLILFADVQAIEKENRLLVNPGITVRTKEEEFHFASFINREKSLRSLITLWRKEPREIADGSSSIVQDISPATDGGFDNNTANSNEYHEIAETVSEDVHDEGELEADELTSIVLSAEEERTINFLHDLGKLKELVCAEIPVSVLKFFTLFYADESDFTHKYHEQRGDKELVVEKWSSHPQYGKSRTLNYRAPVNFSIGPSSTRLEEIQRYHLSKDRLLIEIVSIMHDIPYGDYFRVEARHEVTSIGQDLSRLTISVAVNFLKKTFFEGKINSGTLKESKESYERWVKLALDEVAKKKASSHLDSLPSGMEQSKLSPHKMEAKSKALTTSVVTNTSVAKRTSSATETEAILPGSRKIHTGLLPIIFQETTGLSLTSIITLVLLLVVFLQFFYFKYRMNSLEEKVQILIDMVTQLKRKAM